MNYPSNPSSLSAGLANSVADYGISRTNEFFSKGNIHPFDYLAAKLDVEGFEGFLVGNIHLCLHRGYCQRGTDRYTYYLEAARYLQRLIDDLHLEDSGETSRRLRPPGSSQPSQPQQPSATTGLRTPRPHTADYEGGLPRSSVPVASTL